MSALIRDISSLVASPSRKVAKQISKVITTQTAVTICAIVDNDCEFAMIDPPFKDKIVSL
jgi:hypothetical protein